jgi:hypothetical protein
MLNLALGGKKYMMSLVQFVKAQIFWAKTENLQPQWKECTLLFVMQELTAKL